MKKTILLFCLLTIIFLGFLSGCSNGERKFECTQWDYVYKTFDQNGMSEKRNNVLNNFEKYNLVLRDDNTFTLTAKINNQKEEETHSGTYTEVNGKITLSYLDNYADELLSTPVYEISDNGKTLTRQQTVYTVNGSPLHIVEQKFEK